MEDASKITGGESARGRKRNLRKVPRMCTRRTITVGAAGRGTRGVGFLLFIIFTACEVTKSQRLLFGGISWCRLRISSSSVEKRDRKGLSGLNLFSNSSASVNVAEVIARPRKICRHNRVASRSSNINVSPWSSGFPAWKRLEPLQPGQVNERLTRDARIVEENGLFRVFDEVSNVALEIRDVGGLSDMPYDDSTPGGCFV